MKQVELWAPTGLEYVAALMARAPVRVTRVGIALQKWSGNTEGNAIVVAGLAGGLDAGMRPGDVVIPSEVRMEDGRSFQLDEGLTGALRTASRMGGVQVSDGPLLTASSMVDVGTITPESSGGCSAVDMEVGLVAARNIPVATVRVVLDTKSRSISDEWRHPGTAMLKPRLYRQLLWLGWNAPAFALRAARIATAGIETWSGNEA